MKKAKERYYFYYNRELELIRVRFYRKPDKNLSKEKVIMGFTPDDFGAWRLSFTFNRDDFKKLNYLGSRPVK